MDFVPVEFVDNLFHSLPLKSLKNVSLNSDVWTALQATHVSKRYECHLIYDGWKSHLKSTGDNTALLIDNVGSFDARFLRIQKILFTDKTPPVVPELKTVLRNPVQQIEKLEFSQMLLGSPLQDSKYDFMWKVQVRVLESAFILSPKVIDWHLKENRNLKVIKIQFMIMSQLKDFVKQWLDCEKAKNLLLVAELPSLLKLNRLLNIGLTLINEDRLQIQHQETKAMLTINVHVEKYEFSDRFSHSECL
ncbi:hypothetical protein L596_010195 [Steinernema carpocapsae]|uniref:F-box domain-containing protein n=1 Tax=Steinernema carpocapsae TaxID=34508 RepID=A0A4U5PHN0_STECR|nr:hypothetical protein L596_010195 [Steinernema carpocapsae]